MAWNQTTYLFEDSIAQYSNNVAGVSQAEIC